eukprot:6050-Heterococcus_DN1.PRE.5
MACSACSTLEFCYLYHQNLPYDVVACCYGAMCSRCMLHRAAANSASDKTLVRCRVLECSLLYQHAASVLRTIQSQPHVDCCTAHINKRRRVDASSV